MDDRALSVLRRQLDLPAAEMFELEGPLDFRPFTALLGLDRPDLKPTPWTPRDHSRLRPGGEGDVFDVIRERDVLVHHPYHSFASTVERFLDEAISDPDSLDADTIIPALRRGETRARGSCSRRRRSLRKYARNARMKATSLLPKPVTGLRHLGPLRRRDR